MRRFEPYRWLLGTGEYLDTMMRMLQREALDRLRALRFEDDGYIAVLGFTRMRRISGASVTKGGVS